MYNISFTLYVKIHIRRNLAELLLPAYLLVPLSPSIPIPAPSDPFPKAVLLVPSPEPHVSHTNVVVFVKFLIREGWIAEICATTLGIRSVVISGIGVSSSTFVVLVSSLV